MLIKLLNGDLLNIDDNKVDVDVIRKHLQLDPASRLVLISEGLSQADRELGVTFYAMITPRPTVCVQDVIYANESAAAHYDEHNFEWLSTCVNEDILDHFLPHISNPDFCGLFANPHPKVAEWIMSRDDLCRSILSSQNAKALDYLFAHPDLISLPNLLKNSDLRAIHYFMDRMDENETKSVFVSHIPEVARRFGDDDRVVKCIETVLNEHRQWSLDLLTLPHDLIAEMCLRNTHKFDISARNLKYLAMACTNRKVFDHIFTDSPEFAQNPLVQTCFLKMATSGKHKMSMLFTVQNPSDDAVDFVLREVNERGKDGKDEDPFTSCMPYAMANSHPRMVKRVMEWLDTNRESLKELIEQNMDISWLYIGYAIENKNIDFILYVWREWPEFAWNSLEMLRKLSVTNDVHVEFE